MTIAHPSRLRADSTLPQALREALRELPNSAPEPAQLDALRQQLGLASASEEAPTQPLLVPDRRLKERRLRRTVVALVFFPIAATAAVGTVVELHQRSALPAAATSNSAITSVRSHAPHVRAHGSPGPAIAPAIASEALASPAVPESAAGAAQVPRSAASSTLAGKHRESGTRASEPLDSGSATSEVELLQRANAALKVDPAQALSLTAEHRQLFPAGNLGQEREVIAIKALLALGNLARAKENLARFQLAYPHSAHALELRQIVH